MAMPVQYVLQLASLLAVYEATLNEMFLLHILPIDWWETIGASQLYSVITFLVIRLSPCCCVRIKFHSLGFSGAIVTSFEDNHMFPFVQ